jgi:hypothetical protein
MRWLRWVLGGAPLGRTRWPVPPVYRDAAICAGCAGRAGRRLRQSGAVAGFYRGVERGTNRQPRIGSMWACHGSAITGLTRMPSVFDGMGLNADGWPGGWLPCWASPGRGRWWLLGAAWSRLSAAISPIAGRAPASDRACHAALVRFWMGSARRTRGCAFAQRTHDAISASVATYVSYPHISTSRQSPLIFLCYKIGQHPWKGETNAAHQ